MKQAKKSKLLIPLTAAGFGLRYLVYRYAVDGKNLVISSHPLLLALWVLTVVTLGYLVYAFCRKEERDEPFPVGSAAFLSHGLLGVGMACVVLLNDTPTPGLLGLFWKLFGLAGAVGLLVAGFQRLQGKQAFFGGYGLACLFALVHVVVHYQLWCSNPQLTDYGFDLLGTVALAFATYQLAALAVGLGKKKTLYLAAGCLAFCYGAAMASGAYPYLNLGGIFFGLTCLPAAVKEEE